MNERDVEVYLCEQVKTTDLPAVTARSATGPAALPAALPATAAAQVPAAVRVAAVLPAPAVPL